MLEAQVGYFGQTMKVACDGNCGNAWGINARPRIQLSADEDNYAFLPDQELGEAPADPGTREGRDGKPLSIDEFPNKWCVRECERCSGSKPGEYDLPLAVKDFSRRVCNIPVKTRARMIIDGVLAGAEGICEIPLKDRETWYGDMQNLVELVLQMPAKEFAAWLRELSRFADAFAGNAVDGSVTLS